MVETRAAKLLIEADWFGGDAAIEPIAVGDEGEENKDNSESDCSRRKSRLTVSILKCENALVHRQNTGCDHIQAGRDKQQPEEENLCDLLLWVLLRWWMRRVH